MRKGQPRVKLLLLASAGGAIGSALRYLTNVGFARWLGAGFPWSTLVVNIAGSFAMGFLAELIALRFQASPEMRTFFMTGILGGLTTFSAFTLDFASLVSRKEQMAAILYLSASVGFAILALYAGLAFARSVLS